MVHYAYRGCAHSAAVSKCGVTFCFRGNHMLSSNNVTYLEGSSLMLWGSSSVREHNPRTVKNICNVNKQLLMLVT